MSAKERREHLEQALSQGGTIMTAKGGFTRQVPSSAQMARTPEEKRAAREELERRYRQLEDEARLLDEGGDDDFQQDSGAGGRRPARKGDGERSGFEPDPGAQPRQQQGDDDTLPADFPGRAALAEAGITKRSDLAGLGKNDLTQVKNVDKATASAILDRLKS